MAGGLLGAAASLTTALSKPKSLKQFISAADKLGIQVQNNFEVNFSGFQDITFFIQSVPVPSVSQSFTEVYCDGRVYHVPTVVDYEHDFSMTVINDAQGYIYSAVVNFLAKGVLSILTKGGYTMTVKAMTGDKDYKGALYTYRGVRFNSIGGLRYSQDGNSISTFDLSFKCVDYTATPGALAKAAGVVGAASSLLT